MTYFARPGQTIRPRLADAGTGLAGVLEVEVYNPNTSPATTIVPATAAGIEEVRPETYRATLELPAGLELSTAAQPYAIRWDDQNGNVAEEDLVVTASGADPAAPTSTIATLDELKLYLGTAGTIATRPAAGSAGAVSDTLLGMLLAGAESALRAKVPDRTLNREGTTADPVARIVPAHAQTIRVPDLAELVAVRADGRELDPARVRLARRHPSEPAIYVRLRDRLFADELELVGVWGPADSRDATPAPHVKGAVLSWARAAYNARQSRGADQVRDPNGGVASYFRSVPPDVAGVIGDLTIPGL